MRKSNFYMKRKEKSRRNWRAVEIIKKLEVRITLSEKERAKESRLRKEEQERIIELIDEKHQQEINNTKKESWIDIFFKEIEDMRIDVNRRDKIIEELKNEIRVTKDELTMQ